LDNQYLHFMVVQALTDSLKKIFGESAKDYTAVIFKLSSGLKSQEDVNMAAQFFAKLFESGYRQSVDAHKEILEKYGLTASIRINQNSDDTQTACSL